MIQKPMTKPVKIRMATTSMFWVSVVCCIDTILVCKCSVFVIQWFSSVQWGGADDLQFPTSCPVAVVVDRDDNKTGSWTSLDTATASLMVLMPCIYSCVIQNFLLRWISPIQNPCKRPLNISCQIRNRLQSPLMTSHSFKLNSFWSYFLFVIKKKHFRSQ